jgi:DNA polymerase I-like protein with 3'-5' exonuclease and polymerase domains
VTGSVHITLESIPVHCKESISRFVGYESILSKCPGIMQKFSKKRPSNPTSSNPLMCLSKSWVNAARSGLQLEWRKRSCVEWLLVSDIMSNTLITKVASHLSFKLVALRERDIIAQGPFHDPVIAARLLPESAEKLLSLEIPTDICLQSQPAYFVEVRTACLRTVAVMRFMLSLGAALRSHHLYEIYKNIEMPLLLSASDMQFLGMPADWNFFSRLHSSLTERQSDIERLLDKTFGFPVTASSYKSIAKVKLMLNQQLQAYLVKHFDATTFSSSAWSSGNQLSTSEAAALIEKHPLMKLISETRSISSALTLLHGITKHKMISGNLRGRIRAVFNTVGTDTGFHSLATTLLFSLDCLNLSHQHT